MWFLSIEPVHLMFLQWSHQRSKKTKHPNILKRVTHLEAPSHPRHLWCVPADHRQRCLWGGGHQWWHPLGRRGLRPAGHLPVLDARRHGRMGSDYSMENGWTFVWNIGGFHSHGSTPQWLVCNSKSHLDMEIPIVNTCQHTAPEASSWRPGPGVEY